MCVCVLAVCECAVRTQTSFNFVPQLAGTAKSDLQEFLQKRSCPCPVYREVSRTGSAHIPTFVMSVTAEFNGEVTMKKGVARGKKEAEKEAARAMLAHFGVVPSGSSSGPSVAIDDDDDGLSSDPRDTAKNDLQHKCQSSAQPLPVYETEMTRVRFATVVKVLWAGREYQEVGTGLTKKQAEKDAAYNMLQILPVVCSYQLACTMNSRIKDSINFMHTHTNTRILSHARRHLHAHTHMHMHTELIQATSSATVAPNGSQEQVTGDDTEARLP